MKVSEVLAQAEMLPVTSEKARIAQVGWAAGYLVVAYRTGQTYIVGPDVPEDEASKLRRVPYPDNILNLNKVKHCWKTMKVG